jgi:hypothetical protein
MVVQRSSDFIARVSETTPLPYITAKNNDFFTMRAFRAYRR